MTRLHCAALLAELLFTFAAAPVPRERPFDDARLVGVWEADYGGQTGWVEFRPDGTVYMQLGPSIYYGTWETSRAEPGRVWVREPTCRYPLTHCCKNGARLLGRAPGTMLTLTNPRSREP